MEKVKTKSFELAVRTAGEPNAPKLALVLPGRLDTKDYAYNVSHIQYLSGRGYFAVAFDPPGTWESAGGIELYTTTNYLKAIRELIEHFGNKPTLLMGHSRGGTVAILAGAANPSVEGVVVVMANYGAPTAPSQEAVEKGFQVSYRDLPPGSSKTSERKEFLLPINYFEDGKRYDPIQVLKSMTKPKLVFYGTHDKFIEPSEVKEIYTSIPEPKMIGELDSGHDYRYHPEIIDKVNEAVGQFLDKYKLV